MKQIMHLIEVFLRRARYIMLIPIFFVLASLVYMVILIGVRFFEAVNMFSLSGEKTFEILSLLIDVIDFALLCVIALIIVWGLYEIFLNRLEIQSRDQLQADQILIHDIDELKQKLGKVIVISLVVHIFKHMILFVVEDTIDLLAMGGVVLLLALALYFVEKLGSHPDKPEPDRSLLDTFSHANNPSEKTEK